MKSGQPLPAQWARPHDGQRGEARDQPERPRRRPARPQVRAGHVVLAGGAGARPEGRAGEAAALGPVRAGTGQPPRVVPPGRRPARRLLPRRRLGGLAGDGPERRAPRPARRAARGGAGPARAAVLRGRRGGRAGAGAGGRGGGAGAAARALGRAHERARFHPGLHAQQARGPVEGVRGRLPLLVHGQRRPARAAREARGGARGVLQGAGQVGGPLGLPADRGVRPRPRRGRPGPRVPQGALRRGQEPVRHAVGLLST